VYPFHYFLPVSSRAHAGSDEEGWLCCRISSRAPSGRYPSAPPARPGSAAPCARTWQSGCLILVPGSGSDSALAATAGAAPHLAVVAVAKRRRLAASLRAPELAASRLRLAQGPARADNLAPQGGCPATIGSQAQPGKFPVAVFGMIRQDPPDNVPRCAARQVEYEVGVLRHYHSLCAPAAMIQSPCGNQSPRNVLVGTDERSDRTCGGTRPPAVPSWRLRDVR